MAEIEYEVTSTINLGLRSVDSEDALEKLTESERELISQLNPESAMLIIHRGANRGERFLIDSLETTIGRSSDNDVVLDDVTVSRKHANIRRAGERFELIDLGSLNGTYVNNNSIARATLSSGDEVQFGKFHMLFVQNKKK
ncbi:MAG: FHA domain-containing protein [Candidatus Nanopelagicaceae bacterium]|jgi:pSer/pThr/pTyr-binding forkhead associated (FHA) protein